MSRLFHVLLWLVVSCSCVCRTFTPTANNGWRLAGQSWLAAAFKLMNCLFTITTITTHEEDVLFCVTRIRVWLICRSSEILFHFVSKWIKICELKLCLFCLSVNPSCGRSHAERCEWAVFTSILPHLWTPWTLSKPAFSPSHTGKKKTNAGIQKSESESPHLLFLEPWTLMSISIWRWWLQADQAFCRVKTF